jgi:hypothetical protein
MLEKTHDSLRGMTSERRSSFFPRGRFLHHHADETGRHAKIQSTNMADQMKTRDQVFAANLIPALTRLWVIGIMIVK